MQAKRRIELKLMLRKPDRKCPFCGKTMKNRDITLEHQMPKCRGGSNLLTNLTVTCRSCNEEKGFLNSYEFMLGMRPVLVEGVKYAKVRMSRNWTSNEANVLIPIT